MNLVPNKQLLFIVNIQLTKYKKKEQSVDNEAQQNIGDVYCPKC